MTVLLLATQRELGLFRVESMEHAGFKVIFPSNKLSYSLSSDTPQEFAELIRQRCPGCALMVISSTGWQDSKIEADETVHAADGPEAMITAFKAHPV